jgi:hypothetical protein
MHNKLMVLKEQLCDLAVRMSEQGLTRNLEGVYMAVVAAEKICKMKILEEEEGGYSERRGRSYDGGNSERGRSYDGDSYRGGRSHGDGGSYDSGGSYEGGGSYGEHGKEHMIRGLERLMEEARSPEDKEAVKRFIKQFRDN